MKEDDRSSDREVTVSAMWRASQAAGQRPPPDIGSGYKGVHLDIIH